MFASRTNTYKQFRSKLPSPAGEGSGLRERGTAEGFGPSSSSRASEEKDEYPLPELNFYFPKKQFQLSAQKRPEAKTPGLSIL